MADPKSGTTTSGAKTGKGKDGAGSPGNNGGAPRARKTSRERFVEVAANRTQKAIEAVARMGRCSDPLAYEYTPEEVETMFDAVVEAVNDARAMFTQTTRPSFAFGNGAASRSTGK